MKKTILFALCLGLTQTVSAGGGIGLIGEKLLTAFAKSTRSVSEVKKLKNYELDELRRNVENLKIGRGHDLNTYTEYSRDVYSLTRGLRVPNRSYHLDGMSRFRDVENDIKVWLRVSDNNATIEINKVIGDDIAGFSKDSLVKGLKYQAKKYGLTPDDLKYWNQELISEEAGKIIIRLRYNDGVTEGILRMLRTRINNYVAHVNDIVNRASINDV